MKMKPKRRPASVKAWCFAEAMGDEEPHVFDTYDTRRMAVAQRQYAVSCGWTCGPVVRIEVPAPLARKGKA